MRILISCAVLLYTASVSCRADSPLSGGIGARPLALGGAYVGLANDGSGIFTNPAGLSDITSPNFLTMYSQPASSISFTSIGGIFPFYFGGGAGIAFRNRTISNIYVTTQEVADYTDRDLTFMLARKIRENLSLGLNYRIISRGLSKKISGYEGANGSGGTFDAGLKYTPLPWLGLGFTMQSLSEKIKYEDGTEEELAAKSTLGTSIKLGGENAYFENLKNNLLLNVDISKVADEPVSTLHAGCEWWSSDSFALRLGLDQSPKSSTENYTHITAGFGIKYGGFSFDYAYRKLGDETQSTEHRLSLGYIRAKGPERKPFYPYAKLELLHFGDVPKDYWAKEAIEYLTTLGILNWSPDGFFKPDYPISRAEMVMLLVRAKDYELPQEVQQVFKDVPANYWAADYIQTAREKKLTFGYPDQTFKPRQPTSRLEGVLFTTRFASLKPTLKKVLESPFLDLSPSHWGIKDVLAAADEKIIQNYLAQEDFCPNQSITRAELADLLFHTSEVKQKIKLYFGKEIK